MNIIIALLSLATSAAAGAATQPSAEVDPLPYRLVCSRLPQLVRLRNYVDLADCDYVAEPKVVRIENCQSGALVSPKCAQLAQLIVLSGVYRRTSLCSAYVTLSHVNMTQLFCQSQYDLE